MVHKCYFTFEELTHTDTGLPNIPNSWDIIGNLAYLSHVLSEIREKYGAPIIVDSGFRTPAVNSAVKGSKNSYHLQGRAADIRPNYYPAHEYDINLQHLIDTVNSLKDELKLCEFIIYPTFVHVAY